MKPIAAVVLLAACFSCHAEPASRPAIARTRKPPLSVSQPSVSASVLPKDVLVAAKAEVAFKPPSYWWGVLANWLSYLSLGLTIPVLARVISTIVNSDGSDAVSPRSSVISMCYEHLIFCELCHNRWHMFHEIDPGT